MSKPDLERITKLPEQITLAMPFLHTLYEVEAHRILNKFLKNIDDDFFRERDYMSDGYVPPLGVGADMENERQSIMSSLGMKEKDVADAEVLPFCLTQPCIVLLFVLFCSVIFVLSLV